MEDPAIRETVEFDAISRLSTSERRTTIRKALYAAKVRMPDIRTTWLIDNYDRIAADGGPESVKVILEGHPGRDGKIRFLKSFKGIGDKYARNLLMDVYHPDFRHSIAYDERLKKVSSAPGLDFRGNYEAAEAFFLGVAESAGLNGWELDRLLYQHNGDVLDALG